MPPIMVYPFPQSVIMGSLVSGLNIFPANLLGNKTITLSSIFGLMFTVTEELEKEARTQLVIIILSAESATAISTVTIPVAGIFLIIPYSTMNVVPITLCSISESLIPRLFKRLLLIVTSPLVSYLFSYQYKQSYIHSRFLP